MADCTLLRELKIDLLLDKPNIIQEWFIKLCSSLIVMECDIYGSGNVYYTNDESPRWIFYHLKNDHQFFCNYDHYWCIFCIDVNTSGDDYFRVVGTITKFLVEKMLGHEISNPVALESRMSNSIQNYVIINI